jgi:addiction module RelE/StbE family toxin
MEILFSDKFRKDYKRIKDKSLRIRILKSIKKLADLPYSGKPLKHDKKGYRRLVVKPFRIVYRLEREMVVINCFEHRKKVYKK